VPHVMRMIFGTDYPNPVAGRSIWGAIAVVIADTARETVAAPSELPVGAITRDCRSAGCLSICCGGDSRERHREVR